MSYDSVSLLAVFIYLGFFVAFNTVQVISRQVVERAEETVLFCFCGSFTKACFCGSFTKACFCGSFTKADINCFKASLFLCYIHSNCKFYTNRMVYTKYGNGMTSLHALFLIEK